MRSRTGIASLFVAGFLAAGIAGYILWKQPDAACDPTQGAIGGAFRLVDQKGRERTDAHFRGRYMLVFFGYTNCPDFCPTSLQQISDTLDALGGDARRVQAIFISIDPARDTVKRLATYHKAFHKDIIMLTGSPAAVKQVGEAYRIHFSKEKPKADGSYVMQHSTYTYLMNRRGCYVRHFRHNMKPGVMARALREALNN